MTRDKVIKKIVGTKHNFLYKQQEIQDNIVYAKVPGMIPYIQTKKIINDIFDYFENKFKKEQDNNLESERAKSIIINDFRNRTCENCDLKSKFCGIYNAVFMAEQFGAVKDIIKDFGCNKFENKELLEESKCQHQ